MGSWEHVWGWLASMVSTFFGSSLSNSSNRPGYIVRSCFRGPAGANLSGGRNPSGPPTLLSGQKLSPDEMDRSGYLDQFIGVSGWSDPANFPQKKENHFPECFSCSTDKNYGRQKNYGKRPRFSHNFLVVLAGTLPTPFGGARSRVLKFHTPIDGVMWCCQFLGYFWNKTLQKKSPPESLIISWDFESFCLKKSSFQLKRIIIVFSEILNFPIIVLPKSNFSYNFFHNIFPGISVSRNFACTDGGFESWILFANL